MKLGLGTYCFRWSIGHKGRVPDQPMTAMDVLGFAIAEGCEVLQYADNLPLDRLSDGELDAIAVHARDAGIELEVGIQSFNAQQVKQYIDIAERLDAHILRVALDEEDAIKPVARLADEFVALLPRAKAANVRIAIENHFNYPSRQMVELLNIVDDETVGVCLDVANSICAGEWPMETLGVLAPYTINLHLKDYEIVPDSYGVGFTITGRPLGEGRTDIGAVLAALTKRPDMSVILEHWLPYDDTLSSMRTREADWFRKSRDMAKRYLRR